MKADVWGFESWISIWTIASRTGMHIWQSHALKSIATKEIIHIDPWATIRFSGMWNRIKLSVR